MEIQTKAMGSVPIVEKQIIKLTQGFYGFGQYNSFALIDATQKPFIWVQSLDTADLAFLAIDPFLIRPDYEINIDDTFLSQLEIESPSDVLVFALITIPSDGAAITANLQGPLIINKKNNRAIQAILTDPRWQVKHNLLAEVAAMRGH